MYLPEFPEKTGLRHVRSSAGMVKQQILLTWHSGFLDFRTLPLKPVLLISSYDKHSFIPMTITTSRRQKDSQGGILLSFQ